MAKLLSSRSRDGEIPENYVFQSDKRPGKHANHARKANVPIVDLNDEKHTIEKMMKASQDYGLFQVINHGVPEELMNEAMTVFEDYFKMSDEEKFKAISINGDQVNDICKLYTSSYNYDSEETHYWRDALRHSCSPLEECMKYWPVKPTKYREIVGAYTMAVKNFGSRILELISTGLGLQREYFAGPLSQDDFLTVNHYPPCPDPSLTLGLSKHSDPNLITVLLQGHLPGLQLFKDDEWLSVETLPNAFLLIIGNQLEIVSNGKLKSGVHRAVTNSIEARTSAALFINPSFESIVQPAEELAADENSPPLYKPFQYKDFFKIYTGASAGDPQAVLEAVKIHY